MKKALAFCSILIFTTSLWGASIYEAFPAYGLKPHYPQESVIGTLTYPDDTWLSALQREVLELTSEALASVWNENWPEKFFYPETKAMLTRVWNETLRDLLPAAQVLYGIPTLTDTIMMVSVRHSGGYLTFFWERAEGTWYIVAIEESIAVQ